MIANRIQDAVTAVHTTNKFKDAGFRYMHCNVDGTYYVYNGSKWVCFEMIAGLDYYDLGAKGLATSSDGSTAVTTGDITIVY